LREIHLNDLLEQIKEMADVAEERVIFHDEDMATIKFHRGKIEAYEEILKLLNERRTPLEV
jgi:hypothetical protein